VRLDPASVRTNILVFNLTDAARDAATVVARARERGVLLFAFGPRTLRAVTHLDVSAEACARAGALLVDAIDGA
jgi:threonine aldolase